MERKMSSSCKLHNDVSISKTSILRPMYNTRGKKDNDGRITISTIDARKGLVGSKVYSSQSFTDHRQTTFEFRCGYCCSDNTPYLVSVPEKSYLDHISMMGSWFSSTFIRSFLQLCIHHEHLENTQLEYKLVHCF